jgi:hypothetical protein
MECEYCKKAFSTLRVKTVHQKSTKSCIAIQEQMGLTIKKLSFPCMMCQKEFTTKLSLQYHSKICRKKDESLETKIVQLESELSLKDKEINDLKEKLHAKDNVTFQNIEQNIENIEQQNNITIYQIMSPEHVEDFFKKNYNLDTLLGGQKALARFVNDGFLKEAPVYLCGDRSRQKFYIVKDGKKTEDTDCEEILGLTAPGMPYVQDVYETALFDLPETVTEDRVQDNYQEIITMDEQRSEFKAELSKIISSSLEKKFTNVIHAMKDRSKRLGLMERENGV